MKIVLVDTYIRKGGAAIACNRLKQALEKQPGVEVSLLTADMPDESDRIYSVASGWVGRWRQKFRFAWERWAIFCRNRFSRKNLFAVSIADTGVDLSGYRAIEEADIIHLHWTNHGLLSLDGLRKLLDSGKPVVCTMHDMWYCTAICHHAEQCDKYRSRCTDCPKLQPGTPDLAAQVFRRKKRIYEHAPALHVVTVSSWLAQVVRQSALLAGKPVTVIPNTLPDGLFMPLPPAECRREMKLPSDKYILIFGAVKIDDPLKGFDLLAEALEKVIARGRIAREDLHLVLFGNIKGDTALLQALPVAYTYLGTVQETGRLSMLYSAADCYVSTSLYETFGQTIIEAMACGCVPVAFGNSGQRDIITHRETGFLAHAYSTDEIAEGIEWALTETTGECRRHLPETVKQRYSETVVAEQYIRLYQRMLDLRNEK